MKEPGQMAFEKSRPSWLWCEISVSERKIWASVESAIRADEAAKVWEAAAKVCRALHSSIDHEIAHGKDMGQRGAGYQAACDDIEAHCDELRAILSKHKAPA
jgi:hypothetical protein